MGGLWHCYTHIRHLQWKNIELLGNVPAIGLITRGYQTYEIIWAKHYVGLWAPKQQPTIWVWVATFSVQEVTHELGHYWKSSIESHDALWIENWRNPTSQITTSCRNGKPINRVSIDDFQFLKLETYFHFERSLCKFRPSSFRNGPTFLHFPFWGALSI